MSKFDPSLIEATETRDLDTAAPWVRWVVNNFTILRELLIRGISTEVDVSANLRLRFTFGILTASFDPTNNNLTLGDGSTALTLGDGSTELSLGA